MQFLLIGSLFLIKGLSQSLVAAIDNSIQMGTTIMAVRYENGVVIGADSRTSISGYVSNRFASKIDYVLENDYDGDSSVLESSNIKHTTETEENNEKGKNDLEGQLRSTCCIARSGSAADTQELCHRIKQELLSREIIQGIPGTVTNAAYLARCYLRENHEWSCGILCVGYDHIDKCGKIYSVSPGGSIMEEESFAIAGSGSTYIMGHIDSSPLLRDQNCRKMTEEECVEFVGHAIELAMGRDGGSGGFATIHVIDRFGSKSFLRIPSSAAVLRPQACNTKTNASSEKNFCNLSHFAPPTRSSINSSV
jgi:20S proteasome subunit beta 1